MSLYPVRLIQVYAGALGACGRRELGPSGAHQARPHRVSLLSQPSHGGTAARMCRHVALQLRFQRTLAREGMGFVEIMRVLCECLSVDRVSPTSHGFACGGVALDL